MQRKHGTIARSRADDMPPRIVLWRPVLGCTQLPVGAQISDRDYLRWYCSEQDLNARFALDGAFVRVSAMP